MSKNTDLPKVIVSRWVDGLCCAKVVTESGEEVYRARGKVAGQPILPIEIGEEEQAPLGIESMHDFIFIIYSEGFIHRDAILGQKNWFYRFMEKFV